MLKTRIIPTLLWKKSGLVKGVRFDSWRYVGTVLPAIKVFNMRQVDELIVVDISATGEDRPPDVELIADFSAECFVPLTVGGGIKTIDDVRNILRAGADKVCLNTQAYAQPLLITEIAETFGSQCVVVSIDAKKIDGKYECFFRNGTESSGKTPEDWAVEVEKLGAGEILLSSIDRDGTMEGYDIDLIKSVTRKVKIPVIAAGGAGKYEDIYNCIKEGGASAASAASIFLFTEQTPLEAKRYLASKGIPVRDTSIAP
jgi:cyclase